MADSSAPNLAVATVPPATSGMVEHRPSCGECGVIIGDVTVHTAWHAGTDQGDTAQHVAEFLAGIDPAYLEATVMSLLEESPDANPIAATLDVLKASVST